MPRMLVIALLFTASNSSYGYDREEFAFESYKGLATTGYYTGAKCKVTHIDHVVSLRDAYESGANEWTLEQKAAFANDRENHVVACGSVNSSKGDSGPLDFLRKSSDGKGAEYSFVNFCAYVSVYYEIKTKYFLSFRNNEPSVFDECGLQL